jgi:hypothetical protein
MPAAENLTQPNLVSTSAPIDLEPFRSLGPAALDPGKHPDVARITLRQLQVAREDPLHQTITIITVRPDVSVERREVAKCNTEKTL